MNMVNGDLSLNRHIATATRALGTDGAISIEGNVNVLDKSLEIESFGNIVVAVGNISTAGLNSLWELDVLHAIDRFVGIGGGIAGSSDVKPKLHGYTPFSGKAWWLASSVSYICSPAYCCPVLCLTLACCAIAMSVSLSVHCHTLLPALRYFAVAGCLSWVVLVLNVLMWNVLSHPVFIFGIVAACSHCCCVRRASQLRSAS